MSQPQQALSAARPLPGQRAPTPPPQLPADVTSMPGHRSSETPRLLQLHTIGLVVAGLLFALAGAVTFADQAFSVSRAEADAAQLIRVQNIQTNLLSADATATNAFLVGGLEPTRQRDSYDAAVAASGSLIAEASEAQSADQEALAALNREVVSYAATIEQARANNRQGFPVGAQYLRNASANLRSSALPILDNLVDANSQRAEDEMDSNALYLFVLVGLLVLAALVTSQYWVAKRFKRTLNVGMAGASAVVLITLVVATANLAGVGSKIDDIRTGSFSQVTAAAHARIEAYDAKSNESLTLIARGSGSAFEDAWVASSDEVTDSLRDVPQGELGDLWGAYTEVHEKIRTLDDDGRWDQAVSLATGTDPATSSNAAFGSFDTAATGVLDDASTDTADGLADVGPGLVIGAILTLLAGLVAALLASWGLATRLKEYR